MINRSKIYSSSVGLFSDIHIGLGQDSAVWHQNILDFASWAKNVYLSKNITEIIIPGDIFHNRNEISVNTLNTAKQFFDIFKDFKLLISTGNHDCYYKDRSDVNSISLLSGWGNITLIDKIPHVFEIKNSNKTLSLIPWGVETKDIPKADICVGHFEISSFKMNTYKICDHGEDSSNLFEKSPFIISGHFHHKDFRIYDKGKILYLGSPYQQNFGDAASTRGIYILNLIDENFEFIENNVSPSHVKISLKSIIDGITNTSILKQNIPNNMVSFIIDCDFPSEKLSLLSAKIQNLKPKFFRMEYQNFDTSITQNLNDNNFDSVDISKNVHDFVNALDVNHKEEVISYINEIYHKLAI